MSCHNGLKKSIIVKAIQKNPKTTIKQLAAHAKCSENYAYCVKRDMLGQKVQKSTPKSASLSINYNGRKIDISGINVSDLLSLLLK